MADLTVEFFEYDVPLVQLVDDIVVFHLNDGHSLEVSLPELQAFVTRASAIYAAGTTSPKEGN